MSDRPGRFRRYHSADNAGDHRLHAAEEDRPSVEVEVVTVDDVLGGRKVDFVKMDVQGSEGAALEGMAGALARSPRVKLMTEFWPRGLARAGHGVERFLARLTGLGFRLDLIDEAGLALRRVDPAGLLARFPASEEWFANLLWACKESCVRKVGRLFPSPPT